MEIVLWLEKHFNSATRVKLKLKIPLSNLSAWRPTPIGAVLHYFSWLSQDFCCGYFFHAGKEFRAVFDLLNPYSKF